MPHSAPVHAAACLLVIAAVSACNALAGLDALGFQDHGAGGGAAGAGGAVNAGGQGQGGGPGSGAGGAGGSGAAASYADVVRSDAPVGYWRLGESAGPTAVDASGQGVDGAYSAGVTFGVPGAIVGDADTAIELDGSSAWVTLGDVYDVPNGVPFSLEAWVKPASLPTTGDYGICSKRATNAQGEQGYTLRMTVLNPAGAADVQFIRDGLFDNAAGTQPLPVGEFTHLVATYDGNVLTLYANAAVLDADTNGVPVLDDNTGLFVIGQDGGTDVFHGVIDEVAVYDHALSIPRVLAHYQAGKGQ